MAEPTSPWCPAMYIFEFVFNIFIDYLKYMGAPIFLNTDDTDFTEHHPAHFDNTDAASRQLMTRNLHTPSLVSAHPSPREPIAFIAFIARETPREPLPPPRGGLGRGLLNTDDTDITEFPSGTFR